MEPFHIKEALFLLDRVHPFTIQNEGDGSLQHAIEGIINMVDGIAIRSKKQTSILISFSSLSVLYKMFMLYWNSRAKSVHAFCQKMPTYLDRVKKKKSKKLKN